MTEPSPTVKVAQDLSTIVRLAKLLPDQAVHLATDRLMPGGKAMVALAHVANLEAWEHRYEGAEAYNAEHPDNPVDLSHIEDEDDHWEPPLQTLVFWSEKWRQALGAEYDTTPTIHREAAFLKAQLSWATVHEPNWDRFATDIHKAMVRLEDLLSSGDRAIWSEDVTCLVCDSKLQRRMGRDGYEDDWWCRECRRHLTTPEFNFATAEAARRELGLLDS